MLRATCAHRDRLQLQLRREAAAAANAARRGGAISGANQRREQSTQSSSKENEVRFSWGILWNFGWFLV